MINRSTNMIKKIATFLVVAAAAVITAWAAGSGSAATQAVTTARPNLTEQWQLNPNLSEDAEEKLQSMGNGGEQADRGGGGHGPGSHDRGQKMPEQLAEAQNLILNVPTRFILTQDDQRVVLAEPGGRVRTLLTNNRTVKVDGRDVRTKWENNRLVSETTLGNAKIIEIYERSPSARQLIVTATMEMHGQRVSVLRVYDAVKE